MPIYVRLRVSQTQSVGATANESYLDLDSHADTSVLGSNALLIEAKYPNRTAVVSFADPSVGTVTKNILSGAFKYTLPSEGTSYILVVHQAIHIETMDHSLLCPMQMRQNDIILNETPKCMVENPTEETHSMLVTTDAQEQLRIHFKLRGVTSTVEVTKPTLEEYETLPQIELTNHDLEWDPQDTDLAVQEQSFFNEWGEFQPVGDRSKRVRFLTPTIASITTLNSLANRIDLNTQSTALLMSISSTLEPRHFGTALQENRIVSAISSSNRKGISPEYLSKKWNIPLKQAQQTIKVTTQRGVRLIANPALSRRYKTNDRMLRYNRIPHTVFTDTLKSTVKSKRQNTHAQIYCTDFLWQRAYPMRKEKEAHETLSKFYKDYGVPNKMVMDNAKAQVQGQFRKKMREANCSYRSIEPHSPFQNAAEAAIRELKKATGRKLTSSNCPKILWDDCMELVSLIRSHMPHNIWQLNGQVPQTIMTGQTADISQLYELAWYEYCMFHDSAISFPEDKLRLGRFLGPAIDVGPAMTAKILKPNGNTRYVSTYRPLTPEEIDDPEIHKKMESFDRQVHEALGPAATIEDLRDEIGDAETPTFEPYEDIKTEPYEVPDRDDFQVFDEYIGAEVTLPYMDQMKSGKVMRRKRNLDGTPKGTRHKNPLFDTREYIVEFPDGAEREYAANIIAENMYAQCTPDGDQFLLMEGITDHKREESAVDKADGYIVVNGRRTLKKTTKGWSLCVEWKDGSTSWEKLSNLKESYPIEVAEYATAVGIDDQPAFKWWVPHVLRKRDRIIAKVNSRYHKRTHKFGFKVPKTVEEALLIDKENGDDRWAKAIRKEMDKVYVAFDIKEPGAKPPIGHTLIGVHMVFDIKMENFQFKARLVANGNETGTPASLTYASVVSRESVRIALTIAALNDLEVKTSDIENAYLTAPTEERLYTILGSEFGEDKGKIAVIVRALYGTKSAGASFRNHLADCMLHMGYESCKADPDVWLKRFTKPDGTPYYGYMLLYVDDALCINHDAEKELYRLDKYFKMKPGSIGDPDIYLGGKIVELELTEDDQGQRVWGMSPSKYIKAATANVQEYLEKNYEGRKLPKKHATSPFKIGYRPELDITPELSPEQANFYQSQIGILRWMVELGRVDIVTEVSELASQLAMPREGHLEAVFRIYSYLRFKHNSLMVFDPAYPEINLSNFPKRDWNNFYGEVKEQLPPAMPKPLGNPVILRLFVDADYAGDGANRRSRTGFLIYMNRAPIVWFSKRQTRIENSVFGSEFIAMRTGLETVQGLRYKLRMMGIPIETPTYIYGDNMSVIHNTSKPESVLKKKANSVCYHYIREAVAADECRTGHIGTNENPADIATKSLPASEKKDRLVGKILYFYSDPTDS